MNRILDTSYGSIHNKISSFSEGVSVLYLFAVITKNNWRLYIYGDM